MSARRIVLVVLFALAEAAVIDPLLLLLPTPLRLVDTGVALFTTWALLCAIAFTRRALAHRDASARTQRLVMGIWLIGLLFAALIIVAITQRLNIFTASALLIEFTAVILLWWRGMALGVSDLQPDAARLHLQIGLLMFVIFAVATALNRENGLIAFIIPFLAGALFAMPLSHLEWVEQHPLGRHVQMDREWWSVIGVNVGGAFLASVAVAVLISGDVLASGARLIVAAILLPLVLVAGIIAFLLTLLVSLFIGKGMGNPFQALQDLAKQMREMTSQQANETVPSINLSTEARYVIGLVVVAAIIVVVLWLMRRARNEAAAQRSNSEDLQAADAARQPEDASTRRGLLDMFNLRRWLAALTVRRLYARMGHEARKRGFARPPAQTPYDYLPALLGAFPGGDADIQHITNAYVAAHYGEVPDTPHALAEIRAAWERLRLLPAGASSPRPAGEPDSAAHREPALEAALLRHGSIPRNSGPRPEGAER